LISGKVSFVPPFSIRQIECGGCLHRLGESDLSLFCLQPNRLHMVGIGIQVEPMLLTDFLDEKICELAVEVIASEMGVAIGR